MKQETNLMPWKEFVEEKRRMPRDSEPTISNIEKY